MNVAVAILRLQGGLDCTEILADIDDLIGSKSSGENSELRESPAGEYGQSVLSSNSDNSPTSITDPTRSNST